MKKTKSRIETVAMETRYVQRKDGVYWQYRFNGQGKWEEKLTPYKQIPWIEMKFSEATL